MVDSRYCPDYKRTNRLATCSHPFTFEKAKCYRPIKKEESTIIIPFLLGLDCDICPIHGSSELESCLHAKKEETARKNGNETVKWERQDGRKPVFEHLFFLSAISMADTNGRQKRCPRRVTRSAIIASRFSLR